MTAGAKPGERRGGRGKNTPNRASTIQREKAAKTGLLPADIMLDIARYHHGRALDLRKAQPKDLKAIATIDVQDEIRSEHAMALSAADKVANYYHPKRATLPGEKPLDPTATSLEQMLVEMGRLAPANDDGPLLIEGDKVDAAE